MEKSRTKNVMRNILSLLLTGTIGTVLPFFVRTYTIKYLGSEYMGLNNLCSSFLYALSAADLGVANAFAYRLYKPIVEGDKDAICKLLNFYKKIYFVIGMVILGSGICILPFFRYFISQNIPPDVNIYLIFLLYLMNTVISYTVFAYKNIIFTADQRKDYESITTAISFSMLYTGQILFVSMHQYYLSVIIMPVCTLFGNILRNLITIHKYPDFFPRGQISKSEIIALKKDILSVAIFKFRDISRNTLDSIVLSTFGGLIVLSNYQNYYMVLAVPIWFLTILYVAILPSVGNFAVSNSHEDMYKIYKKNVFIMNFLAAWFAICFCFLIQDFILVWLGEAFQLSWAAVILFSVYIFLHGETMNIKIMRESIGLWNQGRGWAGLEMATNLILNIILVIWIGVEGIILATIISMLFISIPFENRIIFNQYFRGKGKEKIKNMIKDTLWAICTSLIVGALCFFAPNIQYVSLMYKICVCMIIPPLSCVWWFRKTDEFLFVKDILTNVCSMAKRKAGST